MLTALEVYRVHPDRMKERADIEKWNAEHFMIHESYVPKLLELDLSLYLVREKYQMVPGGYLPKTVHELINIKEPNAMSYYVRRPIALKLVHNCSLAVVLRH